MMRRNCTTPERARACFAEEHNTPSRYLCSSLFTALIVASCSEFIEVVSGESKGVVVIKPKGHATWLVMTSPESILSGR